MSATLSRNAGLGTARVRSAADLAGPAKSKWDPRPDAATPLLTGQFARFMEWTDSNNPSEGRFLERLAPGAFRKTIAESRSRMRILFNHGQDPHIGDKPLAAVELHGEDPRGAFYGGYLFPVDYALQLVPALRAGQLGSSFRFRAVKEQMVSYPARSEHNPERLPERTITEAQVFEFGPVTFPAYANATAGVRTGGTNVTPRSKTHPAISSSEFVRVMSSRPFPDTPADRAARERWLDKVAPLPPWRC